MGSYEFFFGADNHLERKMKIYHLLRNAFLIALLLSITSFASAKNYVIKVETANSHVGQVHSYISHGILEVRLYGTKGSKVVKIYPGNHAGDVYWSDAKLQSVISAYSIAGKGKKSNHDTANIWGDRNAWWHESRYYFKVSGQDLGHIYEARLSVKTTSNKSTKSLKVKKMTVYRGARVGTSKTAYTFPSIDNEVIKDRKEYFYVKNYQEGDITPSGTDENKFGEISYQDNLQGTGRTEIILKKESIKTSSSSSSESIDDSYSVEFSLDGKFVSSLASGSLASKIKTKKKQTAHSELSNSLSSVKTASSEYKRTVNPGEFVILLDKYNTKMARYKLEYSFTIKKRENANHSWEDELHKHVMEWSGHNDYHQSLTDIPISKAFDHHPTDEELKNFFNRLVNQEELVNSVH